MSRRRIERKPDGSKKCSQCPERGFLPPGEFSKDKHQAIDGLKTTCKKCSLAFKRKWYAKSENNRQHHLAANKKWRTENRGLYLSLRRKRDGKRAEGKTKWALLYRNDPWYRAKHNCRRAAYVAVRLIRLKQGRETRHIGRLGITVGAYKKYLEGLFKDGMGWSNHGSGDGKWNIDHVRPLASFNLLDGVEVQKAQHYTNTQPMWATENMRKAAHVS